MSIARQFAGSILVIMFHLYQGEKPLSICTSIKPFKKINSECTDFNEVCTKEDDPDCSLFLKTCAQCPVSKQIVSSNTENVKTWFFLIITVLEIVIIFCLLVEIKWKCCKRKLNGGSSAKNTEECTEMKNYFSIDQLNNIIDSRFDKKEKCMQSSPLVLKEKKTQRKATPIHPVNIKLPDVIDPIVVNVGVLDNAVKIKRHISSQCQNLPDYKLMTLKYNGTILDNNAFLFPLIGSSQATLSYGLCEKESRKEFIILKLFGNQLLPELIQMDKKSSIKDTKQIICRLINMQNVTLYKDLVELTDNSTIKKCNLQDDDSIRLVTREIYQIKVNDIFDGSKQQEIDVTNTDKVATLKESIVKPINSVPENIILLLADKYLDPDKFIFKTKLGTGSRITYFCIKKFTGIQIQRYAVSTGHESELFIAKNKDKEVIFKRYDISRVPNLMRYSPLINELRRLQVIQSHTHFVRLHNIYKDDKYLYAEMEKLKGGSMLEYVNKNKPITENLISKWSKQILVALKFIHDNGIIHGDLKPSNILLDLEQNVKISGFDLRRHGAPFGVCETNGSRSRRFMAPEVLSNLPYTASADVWSFGVILVFLITSLPPNYNQTENDAVFIICATQTVQYDISNIDMQTDLKAFIKKCLKGEPSARSSVDKLLQDKFIDQKDT